MTRELGRRAFLGASGTASLAALAGCSGLSNAPDGGGGGTASWRSFQGGPRHHGVATAGVGPGGTVGERWTRTARDLADVRQGDLDYAVVSPPVVDGGVAYLTLTANPADSYPRVSLLALDPADGSVRWRTELAANTLQIGSWPIPHPAIVADIVVVTMRHSSARNTVHGVDVDSGEVRWRNDHGVPVAGATPMKDRLVVTEGTVYALETDGDLAWEFTDAAASTDGRVGVPAATGEDAVYVPTENRLYAVDAAGDRQWERTLAREGEMVGHGTVGSPVVGDAVYVTTGSVDRRSDGRLLALDPADGSTRWEFKPEFDADRRRETVRQAYVEESGPVRVPPVGCYGTPALAEGTLFVPGYRLDPDATLESEPRIYAVDAESGEAQWDEPLPKPFGRTPPVVAGDTVYLPLRDTVVTVDRDGGLGGDSFGRTIEPIGGLAVGNDELLVGTPDSIAALGP